MTNEELADEIIVRFNKLLENPEVRADINALLHRTVGACWQTQEHPTIQTNARRLSVMGLLNGLIGTIGAGPRASWGLISAEFDDSESLVRFVRTEPFVVGAPVWCKDITGPYPELRGLVGAVKEITPTEFVVTYHIGRTKKDYILPREEVVPHEPVPRKRKA